MCICSFAEKWGVTNEKKKTQNWKLVLLCYSMKIIKALNFTTEIFRYEVSVAFLIFLFDFLLLLHIINMSSAFE